ncbi:MAG: lanthionine synthetase LanC family protein [Deinococcales bacterium]
MSLTAKGQRQNLLIDPEGKPQQDKRQLDGEQVAWAEDLGLDLYNPPSNAISSWIKGQKDNYIPLSNLHQSPKADIWLALSQHSAQKVLIKRVRQGIAGNLSGEDEVSRLRDEYHRLVEISLFYPDLVPAVLDFIELEGYAMLVMLDEEGTSIDKYSSDIQLKYLAQLAHALAKLHHIGIVHYDVKLANTLLVNDQLKLIDFGLSRAVADERPEESTPNYRSEETLPHPNHDAYSLSISLAHSLLDFDPSYLPRDRQLKGRIIGLLHSQNQELGSLIFQSLQNLALSQDEASMLDIADLLENYQPALALESKQKRPSNHAQKLANHRWAFKAAHETALASRQFLSKQPTGHAWQNQHFLAGHCPENLNNGAAGIILGLMSLDHHLKRHDFKEDILGAADWLGSLDPLTEAHGLFVGNAGIALALALVSKRYQQTVYLAASQRYFEALTLDESYYDYFNGQAGILWTGAVLAEITGECWQADKLEAIAQNLEKQLGYQDGLYFLPNPQKPEQAFLGLAHGLSGVALALHTWAKWQSNQEGNQENNQERIWP